MDVAVARLVESFEQLERSALGFSEAAKETPHAVMAHCAVDVVQPYSVLSGSKVPIAPEAKTGSVAFYDAIEALTGFTYISDEQMPTAAARTIGVLPLPRSVAEPLRQLVMAKADFKARAKAFSVPQFAKIRDSGVLGRVHRLAVYRQIRTLEHLHSARFSWAQSAQTTGQISVAMLRGVLSRESSDLSEHTPAQALLSQIRRFPDSEILSLSRADAPHPMGRFNCRPPAAARVNRLYKVSTPVIAWLDDADIDQLAGRDAPFYKHTRLGVIDASQRTASGHGTHSLLSDNEVVAGSAVYRYQEDKRPETDNKGHVLTPTPDGMQRSATPLAPPDKLLRNLTAQWFTARFPTEG